MAFKRIGTDPASSVPAIEEMPMGGDKKSLKMDVKSIPVQSNMDVSAHAPPDFRRGGGLNYTEVRKRFVTGDQASSRFVLNELSRKLMSVEEEENRRIEAEVQRRMRIIFENLHKKVEAQAYTEGFAAGKAEGKQEIIHELTPAFQNFDALLKAFDGAAQDIFTANEDFIFRLLSQILKKILLKEAALDRDFVRRAAVDVLNRINTKDNIKLYVSAEHLVDVDKIKEGLSQSLGQLRNLTVEADPSIEGGCRIETEFGTVDASIGAQIANMDQTLKSGDST